MKQRVEVDAVVSVRMPKEERSRSHCINIHGTNGEATNCQSKMKQMSWVEETFILVVFINMNEGTSKHGQI